MADFLQAWIAGGEAGKQQRTDRALRQNLQSALGGDQSAQAAVYQADPTMGMRVEDAARQRNQQAQQDAIGKLHNLATMYGAAPDKVKPVIYTQTRSLMEQAGIVPVGTMPVDLTDPADQEGFGKMIASMTGNAANKPTWEQTAIPDPTDPTQELVVLRSGDQYKNLDGSPLTFGGAPAAQAQAMPQAPAGSPVQAPTGFDGLRAAVEWKESRGNPNAVSPKGAVGRMQTMPGTLRDPGFGVTPARDSSDAELTRVGNEYLQAMVNRYGDQRLALAAYNWGPRNVDAAMKKYGGNVQLILANAPAETKDYVSSIIGRVSGGAPAASAQMPKAAQPGQPISFRRPRFKPGEARTQNAPSGYQWGDNGNLVPIPGGPADRKANPVPADMAQGEMGMRKEVSALLQPHRTVIQQFDKLRAAAAKPSAANDLSMIFSYMKMLDPGSVVREQEFANAQNAAGVPDRVRNMYNNILSGQRLNPNQRNEFLSAAQGLADTSQQTIEQTRQQYADIATQYGWDPVRATGMGAPNADPRQTQPQSRPSQKPRATSSNDPLGIL